MLLICFPIGSLAFDAWACVCVRGLLFRVFGLGLVLPELLVCCGELWFGLLVWRLPGPCQVVVCFWGWVLVVFWIT